MTPRQDLATLAAAVKARLTFEEVFGRLELRGSGRDRRGPCPSCGGGSRSTKFSVRADRLTFRCYACELKGDALDWLARESGLALAEVIRREARRLHVLEDGGEASLGPRPKRQPGPERHDRSEPERHDRGELFQAGLGRASPGAMSYLAKRLPGITRPELERLATELIDGSACSALRAMDRAGRRLWLPLRAAADPERIVSAQGRRLDNDPTQNRFGGPRGSFGADVVLFGRLDHALAAAGSAEGLVVAEGLVDYLTARAAGLSAVVGVPGVGMAEKLAAHLRELGWSGRLLLSLDGDEAGSESVARVLRRLEGCEAIEVCNARPRTGDLNDLWRDRGPAAIAELVEAGRPVRVRSLARDLRRLADRLAVEDRIERSKRLRELADAIAPRSARAKPWKRLQAAIANRRRTAPVTAAIRLALQARSEDPIGFQACVIAIARALDEAADRRAARDNVLRMIAAACVDPIEAKAARAIAERTLDDLGARRHSLAERIREQRRIYSKGVADQEAQHARQGFRTELRREVGLRLLRDVGYRGALALTRALAEVAGIGPEHLARRWELTSAHYPEETREWMGDELSRDLDLERLSREQAPTVRAAMVETWQRERERSIRQTHRQLIQARERALAEALEVPEGEFFGPPESDSKVAAKLAQPKPTMEQARAIVEAKAGERDTKPTRRQAQRSVLDRLEERRRYLSEMLLCPLFECRYREPDGAETRVQQRCNRALCSWCRGGTFARATEILRTAPGQRSAAWELEFEEAEVAIGSGEDRRSLSLHVDQLMGAESYVTAFLPVEEDSPEAVRERWNEALAVMKRHRERHGIVQADWRGVCLFVPELADRPAGALFVAEDDESGVARGLLELVGESVSSSSRDEALTLLFEGEAARTFRIKAALLERDSRVFVDPWAKPGLHLSRALGDQLGLGWVGFDRFRKLLNGWAGVPALPDGPDVLLMWVHAPTGTIVKSGLATSFPVSCKLSDLMKDYRRRRAARRARETSPWSGPDATPASTGPPRSPP